ncbi:MAG TPA: SgcJ/EcaC family oxidoreductase [Thermoanaerobaculia bacterium]|nr:SgcJ/EcaC family oxidoreductase [Thermoanaerobaculia bacterium]
MSEQQIRARFDAFASAWNIHDVEAMANCFVSRGNVTHPWGAFAAGREEIARLLAGEHEGPMRESRWRFEQLTIRQLSETAAVCECDGVIDGVRAPNGSAYELPHRINAVVVNDGMDEDGWYFLSLNPNISRAGR